MSRLVAGPGFSLDFDENRLSGSYLTDSFTLQPAGSAIAAGAAALDLTRSLDGRWHRTVLSYTGSGGGAQATARFDGLVDFDGSGAQRYRLEGVDVTLRADGLDRLGAALFAGVAEVVGAAGNDTYYMGVAANRRFDGGAGSDRAIYGADPRRYVWRDGAYRAETPVVVAQADGSYLAVSSSGTDVLTNVETVTIDGRTTAIADAAFDALGYLSVNRDLAIAFGTDTDTAAAARHYALYGRNERRTAAGFNGYTYLAANPDIAAAVGFDAAAAQRHYIQYGAREGRATGFDAAAYMAANPDVAAAAGGDPTAAMRHYVLFGRLEGRPLGPAAGVAMAGGMAGGIAGNAQPQAGAVTGTTGNDTLSGTAADDTIDGKAGIDTFVLTGAIGSYSMSYATGGALAISGPDGADTLTGVEMLQATDGSFPIASLVSFSAPTLTGLTVALAPTAGNDYLIGTVRADVLSGGAGNDTVAGDAGNDVLSGNTGNDVLLGQADNDTLEGGAGNDRLFGGSGNDSLSGDVLGTAGNDVLLGEDGNDWLDAGEGNDFLDGGGDQDTLFGGLGSDSLRGGFGDDLLYGDVYSSRLQEIAISPTGSYDDVLLGGTGSDTLVGGVGADLMDGNQGADYFSIRNLNESTLAAPDVIVNFNGAAVTAQALLGLASYATIGAEGDRIDVSEIDAIAGTSWNDVFTFVGTAAFSGAGQLRYYQSGAVTLIEGDVNGDLTADFRIQVNITNYTFTAFDFTL